MIALYLILALLVLILFLLFVNIHIAFHYREKAKVTIRILFFRFDGMKLFQYLTREKKPKKEKEESAAPVPQQKKKKKADLLGFGEFLVRIAEVISFAVKEQFAKIKVNLKELYVSVGSDDAAKTALIYGGTIQAANALCALLQHFSNFRCDNRKLCITPDFTSEKNHFSIHLDLTVKSFHLIVVFVRSYFRLFEGKDVNHERNSAETSH